MCVVSEMIMDFRRISEERRCEFENFNGFLRDLRYGFGIVGQAEIVVGQVRSVVGRVESVGGQVGGRGEAWRGGERRGGVERRGEACGSGVRGAFAGRRRSAAPVAGVNGACDAVRQACGGACGRR